MYEFEFRTGKVSIDHGKCTNCATYACVKACSLYGSGILRVQQGKPLLAIEVDEAKRLCMECLACEHDCLFEGQKAITIVLPILGLDALRRREHGNTSG
jgi:hypothetical protein